MKMVGRAEGRVGTSIHTKGEVGASTRVAGTVGKVMGVMGLHCISCGCVGGGSPIAALAVDGSSFRCSTNGGWSSC